MVRNLEGRALGQGLRVAIAVSRFNAFATERLLGGAREALVACGVADEDITVAWVPGAYELPLAAAALADSGGYDALVCLGAVIRGETAHFQYVAGEAARGIATVSREKGIPIGFGVLTTYTPREAMDRSGGEKGNRGYDVSVATLEMVGLLRQITGGEGARPGP